MKSTMEKSQTIQMEVEASWLRNTKLYFPKDQASFFPTDCFRARGKPEEDMLPKKAVPVSFDYGFEVVETDMTMDKSGRIRAAKNKCVGRFYKDNHIADGHSISVTKTGERTFKIRPSNCDDPTV